ncbi:MAG TPA: DUF4276 family protein [Verrucomicrobiota bacterium]|nr:hypothetical protein [Verrucomicrobiales bacterium]HRI15325.1 DUF4276 family protein [Verrucomicrobiota bacterium]
MSRSFCIAPIVEGHGEVQSVPILLRRFAERFVPGDRLVLNPALRVKSASFTNDTNYFRKYVELAARKAKQQPSSCVLILLDCEDACPRALGPALLERATSCRPDVTTIVVLAHREFETWFATAARSLRRVCGLPAELEPPENPESLRDAKGWLSRQMGQPYNAPEHQARFTEAFSFDEAMVNRSFARGFKKLRFFLAGMNR